MESSASIFFWKNKCLYSDQQTFGTTNLRNNEPSEQKTFGTPGSPLQLHPQCTANRPTWRISDFVYCVVMELGSAPKSQHCKTDPGSLMMTYHSSLTDTLPRVGVAQVRWHNSPNKLTQCLYSHIDL